MVRIAVCDDEIEVISELEQYILQYGSENVIDIQIDKYFSGEALLKTELSFDVIFLDIVMNKMNGIETGKIIKSKNIRTQIVYITNFADYCMSAYKVHAFDYIEKPINYLKISAVLFDLVQYMSDSPAPAEYIRIKTESGIEKLVNVDDIRCFKYKESRKVTMYITDEKKDDGIVIRDTIYELYERLNKAKFFLPHRAYIINFKFVSSAEMKEHKIVMTNGEVIYISQRNQKSFKEELHKYMRLKGIKV